MRVSRLTSRGVARLLRARSLFDVAPSNRDARAYLRDPRNVFFLATEAGQPLGFLRGTALRQLHSDRPQMFLYEIGVAAPHRRRGVGRALIRALLAYCRRHSFEEVFVLTEPRNEAAVRLYRSTGAVTETSGDRMFVYRLGRRTPRPRRTLERGAPRRGERPRAGA